MSNGIHKVIITFSFNIMDDKVVPEYKSDKENVKIIPINFEMSRFFKKNKATGLITIKSEEDLFKFLQNEIAELNKNLPQNAECKLQFLIDGHGAINDTLISNNMGNEFNELDLAETIAKLIKNTKEQYPKLKTELKLTQCFGVNSEDGKDSLDDLVLVKPIQNKIINTSSALYPNTNKINMVSSMDKIPKNSVIYQLYSKLKEEYGVEPDKIKGGYGLVMFYTKNDKNRRHAFAYGKNSIILYKNPEDIKQDEKIINLNEDVTCPKDVNIELMKYNNEKTPATFLSSLLTHRSEVYKVDPEPSFLKKLQDALANIAKYFTIG